LERKYSNAGKELSWQYLFPQPTLVNNKRHSIHPSKVQKQFKKAVLLSGINKFCSPHSARHSFSAEYLRRGGNIKKLQLLLGHASAFTTLQTYSHIVDLPENNISPLDSNYEKPINIISLVG